MRISAPLGALPRMELQNIDWLLADAALEAGFWEHSYFFCTGHECLRPFSLEDKRRLCALLAPIISVNHSFVSVRRSMKPDA